MAIFGFAIDYRNGSTDFAVAAGTTYAEAERTLRGNIDGSTVHTIEPMDAETMLSDQYSGAAILTSEQGT